MNINTTINLDDLLNSNEENSSEEVVEILKESIVETAKSIEENAPLPDFDAIVTEWSYRCDKGYPDMKSKSDMIKLQEILNEMGVKSPFKQIQLTEKDKPKKKAAVANNGSGGRKAIGIMLTAVPIRVIRTSVLRDSRVLIQPYPKDPIVDPAASAEITIPRPAGLSNCSK